MSRARARHYIQRGFRLDTLPKRVVIVGGGYIANEFAGIFHGFGAHVRS